MHDPELGKAVLLLQFLRGRSREAETPITYRAIANMLGVSERTVYRWARTLRREDYIETRLSHRRYAGQCFTLRRPDCHE